MNQQCKVCGEPAAGFHFGAFTCEGCKSFFGRSYNNLSSISECKNNGECVINKKNRTSCKACRLRKCLLVGMSKSGSRYGRRSNWFKIHCLLQEQQQKQGKTDPLLASQYDQRLQMQLAAAALSRNKEELVLLGIDDYHKGQPTSPSISSPDSQSDSSELNDKYRSQQPYYKQEFKDLPNPFLPFPTVLPHPAFLPPSAATTFFPPSYLLHKPAFQYDDNFNKRFVLDTLVPRSPSLTPDPADSPMDLSLKSPTTKSETSSPLGDSSDEDEINVDDFPPEETIVRRTTPLDLTTKVV